MAEVHSTIARFGSNLAITMTAESSLSREVLWDALINPAQLAMWLGHVDRPLLDGADYELIYPNGSDHTITGKVLTSAEPGLLEYTWSFNGGPESIVRFTLVPRADGGTNFHFMHENVRIDSAPSDAATWHAQFEFLGRWLNDHIALGANLRQRRNELLPQYEAEVDAALQAANAA